MYVALLRGINIIFFGDWWQLQPVGGAALFSNPFLRPVGTAGAGLQLFWGSGQDSIRRLWELVRPMRCPDPWYNAILQDCRHGCLSFDTYSLLHGFPTCTPGQYQPPQ